MNIDPDRIRSRLKETGLNMSTASQKAGLQRAWLSQVMSGKTRNPGFASMKALAEVLGCDVDYLTGEQEEPRSVQGVTVPRPTGTLQVQVAGPVQAGLWLEIDEMPQVGDNITIDIDPNFPRAEKVAFDVQGDSMDLAGILDGDRIVCWRLPDYPFNLRDGDDVVVERSRDGGFLRERTVKRLFRHPDGMQELRPVSSNKAHKSLRIMPNNDPDGDEQIEIIAVVEDIVRKHRRRFDV
ncbi:LexA family protein [Mangrovibrevibacter kandeliae]|uniref:LexA family protein n=1 Tax=Mangrovibrevibacter kandeliae TaxID=2968473 RepID=UPI002118870F|nr:XRE family transcriptional regulator [Aurantimonas sp. CSK15Z-1]MCQ8781670.1 XRE family transcriptional regulator [Aurantimonas sp. CSK15Z-1]